MNTVFGAVGLQKVKPNMSWSRRHRLPERMDDPSLSTDEHCLALRGLARINAVSRTATAVAATLTRLATEFHLERIRVLDVASGGGDVLLACAKQMRRRGKVAEFAGCDRSETAVEWANRSAARQSLHQVRFFRHDVVSQPLPREYDIVVSTLFLHHLSDAHAELVLRRMASAARRAVIVDDLRRGPLGYWLAVAACHALSRSPVVHYDGPVSVQAAFRCDEILDLARRVEGCRWEVRRRWPQRFLLLGRVDP